jgi:hypothetical protein
LRRRKQAVFHDRISAAAVFLANDWLISNLNQRKLSFASAKDIGLANRLQQELFFCLNPDF